MIKGILRLINDLLFGREVNNFIKCVTYRSTEKTCVLRGGHTKQNRVPLKNTLIKGAAKQLCGGRLISDF